MKKKLSFLLLALVTVAAFAVQTARRAAAEVAIDLTAQGYENQQVVTTLTKDGVTVTFDKGTGSNDPKYYNSGTAVRVYGGGTMSLSVEGSSITKVVFTFGSGDGSNEITANTGTFAESVWTGNSSNVVFTVGGTTGQRRIQALAITLGEAAAVADPTITGETSFIGSTEATITCSTEGAKIYYTLDGSEPTAESTEYTAPIALTATTTVKAIAIKGSDKSAVASKTFTALTAYDNLKALEALENNATFGMAGELQVVAKPTNKYVYVKDATGSGLIFDNGGTKTVNLEKGKTIAANWTGKVSIYKQLFELVPDDVLAVKEGDAAKVTYPTVDASYVTAEHINEVVTLKGITSYTIEGKNITLKIGETEIAAYNQFGLTIAAPVDGKTYDVIGAIGRFNDNIQFQPIEIASIEDIEISPADGDIAAALTAASEGKIVKNITINLTKDAAYTVSAPIVAPNNLVINGNGATIDASALDKAFIQLSAEPTASFLPKNDGNGNTDYYGIDKVNIDGVKVTGLKTSIFYDNNKKYCVVDFTIANSIFQLATESVNNDALIAFQGGGAKDFKVKNSTIYGNNAAAKYFVRYNNSARIDRYGFLGADDTWSFTYENNTFYGLLKSDGQWGNYGGIAGSGKEKVGILTIKNNIWVNCDPQTMRRLTSSKNFSAFNAASAMENNIFNLKGDIVDQGNYSNGSDLAAIVTFPEVADAKFNAELGVAVVPETPIAVGDPRWTVTAKQVPFDIEISPAEGDIAAALATASAGKLVKDIKINLTKDVTYTISAPIVAPNSLEIDGNGATIDASALDKAFIQLSAEPTASFLPKNDGSGNTDYYGVDEIEISGVKVTGLKTSIFYDNNKKYCVDDFTIDNCVFALATESVNNDALIAFQGGGAKDFKVKNSTIYGNNAAAKYFVRYNNSARIDRYGFLGADDTWSFTYENNTFYGLLKSDGQWGNYGGIAGSGKEKVGILTIKNNIWVNCDPQTMRRLTSSKNFSAFNAASAMENNIFNLDGAVVDQGNYSNGSDLAGIVTFEDAAAGKFGGNVELPYGVEKPAAQPGDARWTLTYSNAPQKFAINLTAVENGTVAVDATGNQAEGTIITITATPNEGYELDAITVTGVYSNLAVVVTDGKFTMPADDVTVTVTFKVSTGIQNVSVENNSLENATFYDLNGRRVENPTKKGIYIVNGKKVVIK